MVRVQMSPTADAAPRRIGLRVRGLVQGVGFRPTVHRIATSIGLGGSVCNDSEGVWIELQGEPAQIASFVERLHAEQPERARIDEIDRRELAAAAGGDREFRIMASRDEGDASALLPVDAAPCTACLAELTDPCDRRYRYPFINCTDCGPRYTIVRDIPYDRARTTMTSFTMCAECRREYKDPRSRRFHAEPNGCARCGPRLAFFDGASRVEGQTGLAAAVQCLHAGAIVAVKGVGGFVLACRRAGTRRRWLGCARASDDRTSRWP